MIQSISIYVVTIVLFIVSAYICLKKDWLKTDFSFCVKKIIDCVFYSYIYVFLVYTHYIFIDIISPLDPESPVLISMIFPCILSGWLSSKLIYSATEDLIQFTSYENVIKKRLLFAILSLVIGILMSLSTFNYIICFR